MTDTPRPAPAELDAIDAAMTPEERAAEDLATLRFIDDEERDTQERELFAALATELHRARAAHPGNTHRLSAITEEHLELIRAVNDHEGRDRIRAEALQLAVVALRLYAEGDAAYPETMADNFNAPLFPVTNLLRFADGSMGVDRTPTPSGQPRFADDPMHTHPFPLQEGHASC